MRLLMVSNKIKTYPLQYRNILEVLCDLGHEVIWAADYSKFIGDRTCIPCTTVQISIASNPFAARNWTAYRQLISIIDKYNIEGVLCSTPIGGVLARLAAKKKKLKPVVYEAHGFLFFKGAPLINRTLYKWEEVVLAHYTDVLITITEEDYEAAKELKLRSDKGLYLVHGAGVNVGVTVDIQRAEKRKRMGIPEDAFVIVSAGELNKNKNTEVIVKALEAFRGENVHYVACGVGPEEERLRRIAKEKKVDDQFHLVGYRTDMPEVMAASDVFTMMSFREGIPRAVLEAMDLGLPCVGSNTRGIRDLIDQEGGFICKPNDVAAFSDAFRRLRNDPELRKVMGEHNKKKVWEYSSDVVRQELYSIYLEAFGTN